ncbi:hypothetical protein K432DRAFT_301951 [Lepidopterella palustris CBS 459.81]|uniref:F-box domain-containing protein n=1 Tax=Lepidopterella palustris CBS 459.81 TaxID=1314670 RepID=A0A8E2E775_9PEZI|nr:hypothetical protein K432DRAFT_301951 [Lepidopterella palustris CBS 459.81]
MPKNHLWKAFIIPQNLLNSPTILSSPFLVIPTELLIQIFRHADPLDQLCLALSCKVLLQTSALVSLKTLSLAGHRGLCSCRKIEEFLKRVEPLDAHGKPKRSWGYCVDCIRYRPTRKSYWKGKHTGWLRTKHWEMAVTCWNVGYSLQCPECWGTER